MHVIGIIGDSINAPLQEGMNLKVPVCNEPDTTAHFADIDSLLITRGADNYLRARLKS